MTTTVRRTSLGGYLCSNGEVSATVGGTYWFPGTDYEVTPATQLASLVSTITVETCQPRVLVIAWPAEVMFSTYLAGIHRVE